MEDLTLEELKKMAEGLVLAQIYCKQEHLQDRFKACKKAHKIVLRLIEEKKKIN